MAKFKRIVSIVLTIAMLCTTFLSTGMIAHASMLPLEEVRACLVLNGKTNEELASMKLDDVLNMLVDADGNAVGIPNDATTVWRYTKSNEDGIEEYRQYTIGNGEILDLSTDEDIKMYTLELIIGSSNQLDEANKRYIITVYITNTVLEEFGYELYLQDSNGNRNEVTPDRIVSAINTQIEGYGIIVNEYIVPEPAEGSGYYFGLTSLADKHPNKRVEVYDYATFLLDTMSGADINSIPTITSSVLHQDMSLVNQGVALSYDVESIFALVYFNENNQVDNMYIISFAAVSDVSYIDGSLYSKENGELVDAVSLNAEHISFENVDSLFSGDSVREICLMLKDGYSVDSELYCVLDAHGETYGDNANSYVTKAVEGHYNTIEEAKNCVDIKDQLIPADKTSSTRGYKSNFNYKNGGVPFTVFFEDGNVWKLVVLAIEYTPKYDENYFKPFTNQPIIGEADPWLRVTGAIGSDGTVYSTENKNVYIVENGKSINMDTYYGYGYQTIFINEEKSKVDLSTLKPIIEYANDDRVYAVLPGTNSLVDENHTRDFNNPNQQYTGIIDGNDRNYWVTFKALNNEGSELFVYGPSEREVILDEYFEFKHDILIANVGNAPLEDISVELFGAENVKLDPYWTVGGDGNDTLAAFTTTEKSTQYGELANIAKIRLLPDGDGTVKGTLLITAKGQEPVMITLNGTAQNPEIVTETLDDAVKYVPYQHIIATNNMHDWVETQFSVVDGQLPDGITLNTETGEIYGVPIVSDGIEEQTYTFTVKATFLVNGVEGYFDSATKQFSITVKPNTDENVYLASDSNEGYFILDHVGTEDGQYHYVVDVFTDTVFRSNGTYAEFKDLWLNGEKLVEGVDYDSEEGSTKITIKSQTFENKVDKDETNTIAMEFRKDTNGDGKGDSGAEMNRTAQNFTVSKKPTQAENDKSTTDNVISLIDKADKIPNADAEKNQDDIYNPQTGDNSNLVLWYILLFVSLGGLVAMTYSGMRRRKCVGKQ